LAVIRQCSTDRAGREQLVARAIHGIIASGGRLEEVRK
jgi:hypothetical protein